MPTVPGLVPEQRASVGATPEVSVNAPVEAFGGGVGAALSGLGRAVDQAGDEIWKHAVKIQEMQNQTEADRADTAYMERAGLLHAEFNALQGENAAKAYPKYIQDLKAAREEIRGTLSNDAVRRQYDRGTNSTMGRTIFNGAGHAASQAKKAQIDAIGSKKAVVASQAITADTDEDSEDLKRQALDLARRENALLGQTSEDEDLFKTNSVITAARIQHVAKTDPNKAAAMLASNKKALSAQDFKTTDDIVTSTRRSVGAANIAREVWNAGNKDGEQTLGLGEMQAEARKKAEAQFPGDEIAASHAENAVATAYNRQRAAELQDTREAKNDIYGLFLTGKVNSVQELIATPEGNKAYFTLDETARKSLDKEIANYAKAKTQIANDTNYQKLWRMAKSDDDAAVAQFLNTNLMEQPISQQQLEKLTQVRKQLTKDPKADPRTRQAMGWLRDARGQQLQALNVYKRSGNEDAYDAFTGALVDSIEYWTGTNKKPPSQKDVVDTIGPMLIQKHTEPGRVFGTLWPREVENYVVPDDFSTGMRAKASEAGIPIDDRQIRRAYIQTLMKKYQPPKASDGAK